MLLAAAHVGKQFKPPAGSSSPGLCQSPAKLDMSHCCFNIEQPGDVAAVGNLLFFTAMTGLSGQMAARACMFKGAGVHTMSSELLCLTDCTIRLRPYPGVYCLFTRIRIAVVVVAAVVDLA